MSFADPAWRQIVWVPIPNTPTETVQVDNQPPNQVKGICAPPGFQGTPPPGDPTVLALQAKGHKLGYL